MTRGWLPFGDLTVLMGPNDSGKSRLLARIEGDLDALEAMDEGATQPNSLLYLDLEPGELDDLIDAASPDEYPHHPPFSDRQELLEVIEDEFGSDPGAAEALRLLEHSSTVAVQAVAKPGRSVRRGDLLLHWCAPPLAEMDQPLRSAVEAFVEGSESEESLDPSAPTLIARIGGIRAPLIPAPVRLPVDEAHLVTEVVEGVTQFLTVLRLFDKLRRGNEDLARLVASGQGLRFLETPPKPTNLWLTDPEGPSARIRKDALLSCAIITAAANSACVPFLKARYGLSVDPAPLPSWSGAPRVRVSLLPHAPPKGELALNGTARAFSLPEAADGLQLWVQLAVSEGLDALRITTSHLLNTLPVATDYALKGDESGAAEWIEHLREEGIVQVDKSGAVDWVARLREEQVLPAELGNALPLELEERMAWWGAAVDPSSDPVAMRALRALRPPLYLIDEPERHLNPRLMREAARWLEGWLAEHRAQAIVVSHAVAFLGAGENSRHAFVERNAETASLRPFSPLEVTAMTEIGLSLGLDHGELLGLTRLLLFVEGLGDRAVLETLFGARLRSAGIVVVPISGTKNHPVIVEGDVLLRYCSHRAAVVFDSLSDECIRRLRDPEYRTQVYQRKPRSSTECINMAKLLDAAAEAQREIEPLPLEALDMFDLLDDQTLREIFPRWPGHAEAQLAHGLEKPRDRSYWDHLRTEYGADKTVDVLGRAAARMRDLKLIPAVLEKLVSDAERLADNG